MKKNVTEILKKNIKDIPELSDSRNKERSRYIRCFVDGDDNCSSNWGAIAGFDSNVSRANINSICDVGCGVGNWAYWCATDAKIEKVYGVDPASITISKLIKEHNLYTNSAVENGSLREHENITYLEGDACYISLPDKSVDAVSSFDVFEHILPDDVDNAIEECVRVAKNYLFLSIALTPSHGSYENKNNHATVRSADWWVNKLNPYCKKDLLNCTPPSRGGQYTGSDYIDDSYYTLFRSGENIAIFCVLK